MVASVRGKFTEYDADIATTNDDFTSAEVDLWIDHPLWIPDRLTGINTSPHLIFLMQLTTNKLRLKGNSFTEVDHDGSYQVTGDPDDQWYYK